MLLMLLMLMAGRFERRHSQVLSMYQKNEQERHGLRPEVGMVVNGTLFVLTSSLASVVRSSFRYESGPSGAGYQWTLEG